MLPDVPIKSFRFTAKILRMSVHTMATYFFFILLAAYLELGNTHPQASFGIVGGKDIDITEAPYQAAFVSHSNLFCGAVVVTKSHLLTSGGCCYFVRPGESNFIRIGSNFWNKSGTVLDVKRTIIHPKYDPKEFALYDICVVETKEEMKFDSKVQPLKLAEKSPNADDVVTASGWGYLREIDTHYAYHLKAVEIPIVSKKTCRGSYENFNVPLNTSICAGAEKKGPCYGDFGGPLALNKTLVGVASCGVECNTYSFFPTVFTDVTDPEIRKFITNNTAL